MLAQNMLIGNRPHWFFPILCLHFAKGRTFFVALGQSTHQLKNKMTNVMFPLTKTDTRHNLIKSIWGARGGANAIIALPVTRKEIRETAKEVVSVTKVDDEIRDEEIIGVSSTIATTAPTVQMESEVQILLDEKEKILLKRDVENYRLAQRMPFAIVVANHWNIVRFA